MMKKITTILLATLLLAGCGTTQSVSADVQSAQGSATEEQKTVPATTPAPTATPEPTSTPMPEVSLEEWLKEMPEPRANYQIDEGTLELWAGMPWPQEAMTLYAGTHGVWKGTLEEAAETFHVPWDEFLKMNPNPIQKEDEWSGETYYENLIIAENYTVPNLKVKEVTIDIPYVEYEYEKEQTIPVPEGLNDQATVMFAEAYSYLSNHERPMGYYPCEYIDEEKGVAKAAEGARFTQFSVFKKYLDNIFMPKYVATQTDGHYNAAKGWYEGGYFEGDNDALCFQGGDIGLPIIYAGATWEKPQMQEDGSIEILQVGLWLTDEQNDSESWRSEGPKVACADVIHIVPTEKGWRIEQMDLPY